MKYVLFTVPIAVFTALISSASAGIIFGPVRGQPGESVRLVTNSQTPGGTIERSIGGRTSRGTISLARERDLAWTFRQPAADGTRRGMVRVSGLTSTSKIKIDGKEEKSDDRSPLVGKMFAMSKAPTGDWKFELDGSIPLTRVRHEIEELTVYLKRDWYPGREVNLGDSWEFDPAWIKLIIEKDLAKAQTIGTMRLRQIRRTEKLQLAVIDITIRSTGADFKADGSESSASIDLSGHVTVNLATMLDEELVLQGTLNTETRRGGDVTRLKLPVRLTANKSFVRDGPMP